MRFVAYLLTASVYTTAHPTLAVVGVGVGYGVTSGFFLLRLGRLRGLGLGIRLDRRTSIFSRSRSCGDIAATCER